MRTSAILLVGHGSSFNRDSSAPIYAHAARIKRRGLFDDVNVGFWKERPWICDALSRITCDEVCVVPMFLAEGYFTRQVVPRELGTARTYRLCPPVGTHPSMPRLVLKRAASIDIERRDAVLVVVGHGTERSATSSATVRRVTERLRARCDYADVTCGFLDQEARIENVLAGIDAKHVVLVPFFMAEGYHTRTTIPDLLALHGARTQQNGRTLWYTQAVGTLPEVAWAAVDSARASVRYPLPHAGRRPPATA